MKINSEAERCMKTGTRDPGPSAGLGVLCLFALAISGCADLSGLDDPAYYQREASWDDLQTLQAVHWLEQNERNRFLQEQIDRYTIKP